MNIFADMIEMSIIFPWLYRTARDYFPHHRSLEWGSLNRSDNSQVRKKQNDQYDKSWGEFANKVEKLDDKLAISWK